MFGSPPHLPNTSHNPYSAPQISSNMNIGAVMRRRAAALAERRVRRAQEDENQDQDEIENDLGDDDDWDHDWDHIHHQDSDHDIDVMNHDDHYYREEERHARRDLHEAMLFRREQEDLEIAHLELMVLEADRALEDAKRNLRETKMRIKDRRREERQQLNAQRRVPEFSRPFVDEAYMRGSQQSMRDYLSPPGNSSRPQTPQPSSSSLPIRSRSPSPYRFSSTTKSEIPIQSSQPPHRPRSRSRTPDPTAHKEKEDGATSAAQEQVYQSFSKLHDLAKEFQALRQNFVYPSVIEFQKPGSQVGEVITVWARSPPVEFEHDESILDGAGSRAWGSEGKLAYTRANEALHAYAHTMEKLLGELDSVDSWNETSVRTRRRGIISDVEQEASRLERYRQKVWHDYLARSS